MGAESSDGHESIKGGLRALRGSVAFLAVLALLTGTASAGVGDYRCTDPTKVYYGNARLFQRPAMISSDEVYRHIPEYKEIVKKGLDDKDARYHFLMKKASARFTEAVKQTARDLDHDLIAEDGAVSKAKKEAKDVPERTDEVIQNLK